MTKGDFRKLFLKALNAAADNAEATLALPVPRSFKIELHAPRSTGTEMGVDEALDQIWLGNTRFYRVIDVAIKEALPGKSLAFVRVSGHAPTSLRIPGTHRTSVRSSRSSPGKYTIGAFPPADLPFTARVYFVHRFSADAG